MTRLRNKQRRHAPPYQLGMHAIVLGAREGNIGGAIAERLCTAGWIAQEDDCERVHQVSESLSLDTHYEAPFIDELVPYDACIITLGVTHMEPFHDVSQQDLHKVLYGALELPLECARRYVKARTTVHDNLYPKRDEPIGKLLFIGSYAHDHPFTHCTSYCVAKAGLDMAVRSLAWELMPRFDVYIIHPHHVQGTPMTDVVRKGMMEGVHNMTEAEAEAYSRKDLRMPDILKPCEIAEVALWLLSNNQARWLSGSGVEMYGGVR